LRAVPSTYWPRALISNHGRACTQAFLLCTTTSTKERSAIWGCITQRNFLLQPGVRTFCVSALVWGLKAICSVDHALVVMEGLSVSFALNLGLHPRFAGH
jgi:hypothetical protein